MKIFKVTTSDGLEIDIPENSEVIVDINGVDYEISIFKEGPPDEEIEQDIE